MLISRKGDTLIEVMMSFAILSVVVLLSLNSMNAGITEAEASLELSLARSEINSQAEAIRFIHNSFLNDREMKRENQEYLGIWSYMRSLAVDETDGAGDYNYPQVSQLATKGCGDVFSSDTALTEQDSIYQMENNSAFIVNSRNINYTKPEDDTVSNYYDTIIRAYSEDGKNNDKYMFKTSSLNPRIIFERASGSLDTDGALYSTSDPLFTKIKQVEGLWDIVVKGSTYGTNTGSQNKPGFYDFHINACWNAPGRATATTLTTIVRLYNPEYKEEEENINAKN